MLIVFVALITLVNKEEILEDKKEVEEVTNPYLPNGFAYVEDTNLKTGLTIEDSSGNQYVWIVVPQTLEVYRTSGLNMIDFTDEDYITIEYDLHEYSLDYRKCTMFKDGFSTHSFIDKYAPNDFGSITGLSEKQYYELKNKMLKSIYQNGGFYIGKYETGILDSYRKSAVTPLKKPVIQANAYPYNFIECSEAQTLASHMETGEYTSSLMFGLQWDLVLKYLETRGIKQEELNTDSTNWGNYYNSLYTITNTNSKYLKIDNGDDFFGIKDDWYNGAYGPKTTTEQIILSTGASETFSKMGIYDLAGNVWEWTLECGNLQSTITKRGDDDYFDKTCQTSDRLGNDGYADVYTGFRVTIY